MLFSNETKSPIAFLELAKSIENYNFPDCFTNEVKKLCDENYILPSFGNKCIPLNNPLKGDCFDVKTLKFKTIENNRFAIELIENSKYRNKEEAIAILRRSYIADYQDALIQHHVKIRKNEDAISYILRKEEYIRSNEHQQAINEFLKKTNFEEKKKKIEDSILTINGEIWDNSGGLLEWAIRNGFIEENFSHNCITVRTVG